MLSYFNIILNLSLVLMVLGVHEEKTDLSSRDQQQLQAAVNKDDDGVCICTAIYDPVCGSDGETYSSPCVLGCKRKNNPFVYGLCKGECPCCKKPYFNEPLINHEEIGFWGWDLKTGTHHQVLSKKPLKEYADNENACSKKEPVSGCICFDLYEPVCGSDGVTYGNSCELSCQQKVKPCLKQACQGECPCCPCSSGTNY